MIQGRAWRWAAGILWLTAGIASAKAPGRLGIVAFPPELAREQERNDAGATVYLVLPTSPAGKAKLAPGDVITNVNDEPIQSFPDLLRRITSLASGQKVKLKYTRDGKPSETTVTLSAFTGELTAESYQAGLSYLRNLQKSKDGPVLRREIISHQWSAGERQNALKEVEDAIAKFPKDSFFQRRRLEILQKNGDYQKFVDESTALADKSPRSNSLQLQKVDALLAVGRNEEAENLAYQVATSASFFQVLSMEHAVDARRKWATARLRLGKSLVDDREKNSKQETYWNHPEMGVLDYWRKQLGNRPTYQVVGAARRAETPLQRASVMMGLVPYAMHGITIKINGVDVPLAIVDTGASHTLISTQTAVDAKVDVGTNSRPAVGSLNFTARPGVIRELRIGDVVLNDVPVSVGNPPPLVMTKAKVALGVDLMHHLRFTLDYPKMNVVVEVEDPQRPPREDEAPSWDIPLWTFADHCLSQGKLSDDSFVRILIDSGNFAATLVWPDWAKMHIPNHRGASGSMFAYAMSNPQNSIKGLSIGGRTLPDWPAVDMPPVTLQGVDLLDLLMGHDLLSQYRVTVDMRNRRLRLRSPGGELKEPKAPKPLIY